VNLGKALKRQYIEKYNLLNRSCDLVGLETFEEQKNQKTIEYEYRGLCDKV
jgi:hypothetical protein